jgi:type VI protein secretion system component Hcp
LQLTIPLDRKTGTRVAVTAAAAALLIQMSTNGSVASHAPVVPLAGIKLLASAGQPFMTVAPTGAISFTGESTAAGHVGSIELADFDMSVLQAVTTATTGTGAGAGKAVFKGFNFSKRVDNTTVSFLKAESQGAHIPTATIVFDTNTLPKYLTITFSDVLVSSDVISGSAGELPKEQITLQVGRVKLTYQKAGPTGTASGLPTSYCWNFTQNVAC